MKLSLKKWMAKASLAIKNLLTPSQRFSVEAHSIGEKTLASGAYVQSTASISKAGYRPLGIVGRNLYWKSGSTMHINCYYCYLDYIADGSATICYGYGNVGTGTTKFEPIVSVLWAKVGGVVRNILKALQSPAYRKAVVV